MTQAGPYGCCGYHTLRVGGHGGRGCTVDIRTSPSEPEGVFSRLDPLNRASRRVQMTRTDGG